MIKVWVMGFSYLDYMLNWSLIPHFGRLDLLLLLGREELSQLLVVLELSQHVAHNSLGM